MTTRTRSLIIGDFVIKAPLSHRTQLEASFAPYQIVETRSEDASTHVAGFGEIGFKLKINLLASDGVSIAVNPGVRLPTARRGLGASSAELVVGVPIAVSLPNAWSLTLNPQVELIASQDGDGKRLKLRNLFALSRPAGRHWIVLGEIATFGDVDVKRESHSCLLILGGDYTPSRMPNLHLDVGAGAGLNRKAPDRVAYLGFSWRF